MKTVRTIIADVRQLRRSISELTASINQLQREWPAVNDFIHDSQLAVEKWRFKDQARIDKIKTMADQLSKKP